MGDTIALTRIEEAPKNGFALLYTRKNVHFFKYQLEKLRQQIPSDLLEMHLFDRDKEYRCIASRGKKAKNGYIEHIADFSINADEEEQAKEDQEDIYDVYSEEILLEEKVLRQDSVIEDESEEPEKFDQRTHKIKKITVYNQIHYGKNGMVEIDDYRLCIGGDK